MTPLLLAGDVGGTKTSLRLLNLSQDWLYEKTYQSNTYVGLVPLLENFLQEAHTTLQLPYHIVAACLGVAGPVVNNTCQLTNLPWPLLQGSDLAQALNIPQVALINDFTAIGYGILGLKPTDLFPLQAGVHRPESPIALLGAGTGMGQGFLIPQSGGNYQVFASEGGHVNFAPRTSLDIQLLEYLQIHQALQAVAVEHVVSGVGITYIYRFLRHQFPQQESAAMASIYQEWQQYSLGEDNPIDLAAVIAQQALERMDELCQRTLEIFIAAYGAEAGNLALKILPYGGIYIAGGIAPKILPLITAGPFLQAFLDKGNMASLMAQFPIFVVRNPQVGLIGAGIRAAQIS